MVFYCLTATSLTTYFCNNRCHKSQSKGGHKMFQKILQHLFGMSSRTKQDKARCS